MFRQVGVKQQLFVVAVFVSMLLCVLAVFVWQATRSISEAANQMGQGKDVVADILPPPLYVLEAQFTALQIQESRDAGAMPLLEKIAALKKDYDDRIAYWQAQSLDSQMKQALLGNQRASADAYWALLLGDYKAAAQAGDQDKLRRLAPELLKLYQLHRDAVDQTVKVASAYADHTAERLQSTAGLMQWLVPMLTVGGAALVLALLLVVMASIMRRLGGEPGDMQSVAREIAVGNLAVSLRVERGAEESLAGSFELMRNNLRGTIEQVNRTTAQLVEAARGLAGSAARVAERSSQQSEATAAMAAAMEEVTVSVSQVSGSANVARNLAEETQRFAIEGRGMVQETISDIDGVASTVGRAVEAIETLSEQSKEISSIVQVIKEIADQTNLLALNAAIEAARAGEQGRGFAVVADEVRKLAERTSLSTTQIVQTIENLQKGARGAVDEMAIGHARVAESVAAAGTTGDAMLRIEESIGSVLQATSEISDSLREESAAGADIANNVERVARMTDENSAAVASVSSAAERLSGLAAELRQAVDRFRL